MGNVIQTNVASLGAQKSLFKTNNELSTTFSRLSSGFRINSARDDASGLVLASQLAKEVGGARIAARNANDGISFAQVAEGALQEISSILLRMRDIAVQASSGQVTAAGQTALDAEFSALDAEITRIVGDTEFAGGAVFSANATNITVDTNGSSTIAIATTDGAAFDTGGTDASAGLAAVDTAITAVDTQRGILGAAQNRLTFAANNLNANIENSSAALSRIRDTDYAVETANLAKNQVLQQAGFSVLAQANASSQSVLSLLQ
ncbi:flagellin FliC [Aliikangiella marina]|uniref:Flagellin n=1 Tax=Aliikangiella marina TaxID=1712262 RepID=A0A545TDM0_9GAMM|nr:flagellin [Aliikangiella marina]TQV75318.1 flagellin FliC [Aliikangiella marina]